MFYCCDSLFFFCVAAKVVKEQPPPANKFVYCVRVMLMFHCSFDYGRVMYMNIFFFSTFTAVVVIIVLVCLFCVVCVHSFFLVVVASNRGFLAHSRARRQNVSHLWQVKVIRSVHTSPIVQI